MVSCMWGYELYMSFFAELTDYSSDYITDYLRYVESFHPSVSGFRPPFRKKSIFLSNCFSMFFVASFIFSFSTSSSLNSKRDYQSTSGPHSFAVVSAANQAANFISLRISLRRSEPGYCHLQKVTTPYENQHLGTKKKRNLRKANIWGQKINETLGKPTFGTHK